jgi:5-hydroxyisourate hydrolase-like protein (transthyretin family)
MALIHIALRIFPATLRALFSSGKAGLQSRRVAVMSITLSVVDGTYGCSAEGISVSIARRLDNGTWRESAPAATDGNGQITWGLAVVPHRGVYRIQVAADSYFAGFGIVPVQPVITMTTRVADPGREQHISLLITPTAAMIYHIGGMPEALAAHPASCRRGERFFQPASQDRARVRPSAPRHGPGRPSSARDG